MDECSCGPLQLPPARGAASLSPCERTGPSRRRPRGAIRVPQVISVMTRSETDHSPRVSTDTHTHTHAHTATAARIVHWTMLPPTLYGPALTVSLPDTLAPGAAVM